MTSLLLRVLLVEDSEDDALLTLRELRKGGFATEWERVDTRAAMERALAARDWELVICDHVMPGFSSAGALDVMRKRCLDLPFIIVSGVAPEDLVTAAMRQGAHDFISKGNLVRLVPAVQRELKEADLRRDRRRMEFRLVESEQRTAMLAAAVAQVAEAIAITDPQGNLSYANCSFEQLTGFTLSQVQGCDLGELLGHRELDWAARQAGSERSWEGRLALRLEGREAQDVDVSLSPVRDAGEVVRNLVVVLRDVTKELELERQLRQAQKMDALGLLAAGIAHDFNNVLTTILASAELIKCKIPEDSPLLPRVEAILHAGQSAAGLTRQILGFSRKADEKRVPLDFTALVRDALRALQGSVPAHIDLDHDLMSGIWVNGDPALFQQVVLNLVFNAIHAMEPQGGRLHVSLGEETEEPRGSGRCAVLTVRDTGCGMEPQVLERIFDPFFTTKAVREGTGLGLTMVQATVTKAGGRIAVQSTPGQGTSFRIQLPCATGQEPARPEAPARAAGLRSGVKAPAPAPAPAAGPAPLILLAEDSNMTRSMIRGWLEQAGYRVQEARDGLDAWELFTRMPADHRFDLLLTDVVMPRMDGLELIQLVRKADPAIPIGVLTSNEDKETVKAALHLGVNEFLNKPFVREELTACVRLLLTERSSRLDARRSLETAQAVRLAQRSMVAAPEKGVPLYTLYEPLSDAGGDVFRCFTCADGSILFILADVAGHSVLSSYAVASFLGMLSSYVGECFGFMALSPNQEAEGTELSCTVHGCGRFGHWPCDPLPHLAMKLNYGIQSGPFSEVPVCTLLGLWTPATGKLKLLNAGIPHGLHYRRALDRSEPIQLNGVPLGVFPEAEAESAELQLEPGDRFLFGTDGFFEAAPASRQPFQELAPGQWQALAASPLDWALSVICEAARGHGDGQIADDLLVVGFEQPSLERGSDELMLDLPSTAKAVDMACDRLKECLKHPRPGWVLGVQRRFDILLAVREALTNAVFHGNDSRPGTTVSLRCRPGPDRPSLVVSVADQGTGFDLGGHPPPDDPLSERGRGLPLIRHHAQDVQMQGSTMTMTFLLEENDHDDQ